MVRSGHGRADAGAGLDDVPKDVKGTLDLLQYAVGHDFEVVCADNVLHQNRELVPAQPRSRVLGAQRGAKPPGNRHQQNIAGGVAQRVVDFLKAVKVDIEHAAAMIGIAHAPAERQVEPVKKQRPVGQSRHHVVHGVVLQLGFGLLVIADVAEAEHVAHLGAVHKQRRDLQAHIHQLACLVHAHRFHRGAAALVHGLYQRRILVEARLRHNQFPQAAAASFLGGVAKHAGKCRIGVQNMVFVLDGDGLGKAGQYVFHQPRFGCALASSAGMGHDHRIAHLRIQDAVGAFHRHQLAILRRQRGMKRAAAPCARQQRLRLRRAGKQSPQNVLDRPLNPLPLGQAKHFARFGVGKDNLPCPLKKNQNRQAVENLQLCIGVRVLLRIQSNGLPGRRRSCRLRALPFRLDPGPECRCCHIPDRMRRSARHPSPKSVSTCNQSLFRGQESGYQGSEKHHAAERESSDQRTFPAKSKARVAKEQNCTLTPDP